MKKLLTLTFGILFVSFVYSQGQNWKITGNTISLGDYLGTNNNEPLIFKANGNEGLRIKPNGDLRIKNFDDNTYTGLMFINTNGVLNKLNFTGSSTDVLLGNGTFGSFSSLSGWTLGGNNIYTTYNVGIGTNVTPEKLTVNGNILANGSISGTSLNVVDIVGAGKEFKISTSLCMKGIDVNTPGSRNELCGMNGDLFIQSEHNNNYNTVFGLGNGSKTGFGIIPTEKFHVGVDAKFEGNVNINKISFTDSVFTLGDSTLYFSSGNQNIFGNTSGTVRGIGLGGNNTIGYGLNSVAIGKRVRASGNYSIVIGKTESPMPVFHNTIDNSLMVVFNSNIPTLFVGNSNGLNTFGKVGIGTSTPGDRLQIGNDYTSVTIGPANFASLDFGTSYIGFNATRNSNSWTIKSDGSHNGGSIFYTTINGEVRFANIPSSSNSSIDQVGLSDNDIINHTTLYLTNDNAVGIATNCVPYGYKLAIKGSVIAEEVVVKLTDAVGCWPDFVFEENYKKTSFLEKESFIRKNKHLPYLPSANDIEHAGLNINNTLVGLTHNLEENTIDIIEIYKKLELLQVENEKLKKEIEDLKSK